MTRPRPLRERLFSGLIIDPGTGCLLWQRARSGSGYGRIWNGGRLLPVHRLMYEIFTGPIPDGFEADHLCGVRHCGSPAHLEAVTPRENTLRSSSGSAINARKTHCIAGHLYDEANTRWGTKGERRYRECRECTRRRNQKKSAARKLIRQRMKIAHGTPAAGAAQAQATGVTP